MARRPPKDINSEWVKYMAEYALKWSVFCFFVVTYGQLSAINSWYGYVPLLFGLLFFVKWWELR